MLLTVRVNIICQTLQENMRYSELVTSDTTPHVGEKAKFIFIFSCSMCIITIAWMGVSPLCVWPPRKSHGLHRWTKCYESFGVSINSTAELQLATHVRRCKMPDTFDISRGTLKRPERLCILVRELRC